MRRLSDAHGSLVQNIESRLTGTYSCCTMARSLATLRTRQILSVLAVLRIVLENTLAGKRFLKYKVDRISTDH